MKILEEILKNLTGVARSQDLAYTKNQERVNEYFDTKVIQAISAIKQLLKEKLPKEKEIGLNYMSKVNCVRKGFNDCLSQVNKLIEEL